MAKLLKEMTVALFLRISENLDNEIDTRLEEYNKVALRPVKKSTFIQMCIEKGCSFFAANNH